MTQYEFTSSAFSGASLFAVTDSGVALVNAGVTTVLPFADIAPVALAYEPSRVDLARYTCRITGRGGQVILVPSSTYRGIADFESQADAYRDVVFALHRALLPRAPEVRFGSGVSASRYLLNIGCLLVSLPMLLGVLAIAGTAIGIPAVLHLVIIVALLPFVWKWMRRNRPGVYDPRAIPAALLPPAEARGGQAAEVLQPPPAPMASPRAAQAASPVAPNAPSVASGSRRYTAEDFGPIAEPGDQSWLGAAGYKTHWADAEQYAREANEKLDKNLIGPPLDPPPQGEQPLR